MLETLFVFRNWFLGREEKSNGLSFVGGECDGLMGLRMLDREAEVEVKERGVIGCVFDDEGGVRG